MLSSGSCAWQHFPEAARASRRCSGSGEPQQLPAPGALASDPRSRHRHPGQKGTKELGKTEGLWEKKRKGSREERAGGGGGTATAGPKLPSSGTAAKPRPALRGPSGLRGGHKPADHEAGNEKHRESQPSDPHPPREGTVASGTNAPPQRSVTATCTHSAAAGRGHHSRKVLARLLGPRVVPPYSRASTWDAWHPHPTSRQGSAVGRKQRAGAPWWLGGQDLAPSPLQPGFNPWAGT